MLFNKKNMYCLLPVDLLFILPFIVNIGRLAQVSLLKYSLFGKSMRKALQ